MHPFVRAVCAATRIAAIRRGRTPAASGRRRPAPPPAGHFADQGRRASITTSTRRVGNRHPCRFICALKRCSQRWICCESPLATVQAGGQDFVDAAVAQVALQTAGAAQGFVVLLVGHQFQVAHRAVHAGRQGTWHVGAQDQQFGHLFGVDHVAVDLAVNLEAGHRPQDGAPVVKVHLLLLLAGIRAEIVAVPPPSAWNFTLSMRAVLSARSM